MALSGQHAKNQRRSSGRGKLVPEGDGWHRCGGGDWQVEELTFTVLASLVVVELVARWSF